MSTASQLASTVAEREHHKGVRPPSLLTDAEGVGIMIDKSSRSVRRLGSAGLLPRPVKVGGAVKWRVAEIEAWVCAGCPDRATWERIQKTS